MEGSCAALISKVESHMDVNTLELYVSARKLSGIVSTYRGGVCGRAVNTSNSGSEVRGSSLARRIVSLDKKVYSTLSLLPRCINGYQRHTAGDNPAMD